MAVIDNLSASITSFKVNGSSKNFQDCLGTYSTSGILNGGETYDEQENTQNILSYGFKINGLIDHTIKSIIVNTLLLDSSGGLTETRKFRQVLDGILVNSDITGNINTKVIGSTEFNLNKTIEDSSYEFTLELQNTSNKSCYYCIESIIINLSDIKYKIHISFSGPVKGRRPSSILVNTLLQNLEAVNVTFSKDPTKEFDKETDTVEGKVYFRKDGIYVDGYQYGVTAPATENKQGLVKLSKSSFDYIYEEDEEGNQIQVGIEAPVDLGVAASTQLVYNILASAINYTDEQIAPIQEMLNGIEAPLIMNIENEEGETESLGEELTFSNDFEQVDKKLYIKWLEII